MIFSIIVTIMVMSKYFGVLCILFVILYIHCVMAMTREQLRNTGKIFRKNCAAKNNLTDEIVGKIDSGFFLEETNFMCYIACIYKYGQVIKNNKLNYDAMVKQVDIMFPEDMKAPVKVTIEKCRHNGKKYKDICEVTYYTVKCLYDTDPSCFVFP